MTNKVPNPGSEEAGKMGCKCPVIDNHYGKGVQFSHSDKPDFWINMDCKLHNKKTK